MTLRVVVKRQMPRHDRVIEFRQVTCTEIEGHTIVSAWDVLLDQAGEVGSTLLVIDEEYGH